MKFPNDTRAALIVAVMLAAGCVPVPPELNQDYQPNATNTAGFQDLDAGAVELASQHLVTKGYGSEHVRQVSDLAENIYNRLMTDTGLYTFQPPALYHLLVYANRDEYMRKTQQQDWSAGITVNNVIYVFDGPQMGPELAHQMAHLIFFQYMASPRQDYRWLDEGLAMYEQLQEMNSEGLSSAWTTQWRNALRTQAMPFDQMINLVPATERNRLDDLWHEQVGDVVRFMIERGGRNGMSQFLGAIRLGQTKDNAVNSGFPGIWSKFADLENAWRLSL